MIGLTTRNVPATRNNLNSYNIQCDHISGYHFTYMMEIPHVHSVYQQFILNFFFFLFFFSSFGRFLHVRDILCCIFAFYAFICKALFHISIYGLFDSLKFFILSISLLHMCARWSLICKCKCDACEMCVIDSFYM